MYLGTSMILTMYLTEYYARHLIADSLIANKWGILAPIIPRTLYLL
jgi:sterol O-acyltransferase